MVEVIFEPITPKLGAYVRVSADELLDAEVPIQVLNALNQYGVLIFPRINLSDGKLVAFTNELGDMEAAHEASGRLMHRTTLKGYEEIA